MTNKQFFEKSTKAELIKFAEALNRSAENAKKELFERGIECQLLNGEKIDLQSTWFRDELRKISNYRDYFDFDLNEPLTKKEICGNIEDFLAGIAVDDEAFLKSHLVNSLRDPYDYEADLENRGYDIEVLVNQFCKEMRFKDPYEFDGFYDFDISAFEKDYDSGSAEFFGDLASAILNAAWDKLEKYEAGLLLEIENLLEVQL